MHKLVVVVDVDETIADLLGTWLPLYNRDWNDSLTREKITNWDLALCVKPECGAKVYDYLCLPNFYRHLPLFPGAYAALEYLHKTCHLRFATAINEEGIADRLLWFKDKLPWVKRENIVFTAEKEQIPCDILIEDNPRYLTRTDCVTIAKDQTWNQGFGQYRFKNWNDIYRLLSCVLL